MQDIIQCRECGSMFDLERQSYYTNLCPGCKEIYG